MRKERIKYTDDKGEMRGKLVRVKDFLPSPNEPVESVTVTLRGEVLSFFQREAGARKTTYHSLLRELVRSYARLHSRV